MSTLQVINLYAQLEPPKAKPIASLTMIGVWVAILVGYCGYAAYLAITENQLTSELAQQSRLNKQLQFDIEKKRQTDDLIDLAPFENSLASLRYRQQRHELLIQYLESAESDTEGRFSEAMAALARQHLPGLALERFTLMSEGNAVSLSGALGNPEVLPRYVRRLGREGVFSDLTFSKVLVKAENESLSFEMSTRVTRERREEQGS